LDIGDDAERETGKLVGLEGFAEAQFFNRKVRRTAAVG